MLLLTVSVRSKQSPGYGPLIRVYVQFILAKLRFHRLRPEFNGLFEYEEYISLKGIDDPNEGYVLPVSYQKTSPLTYVAQLRDHF
jgi:hypothetical protein